MDAQNLREVDIVYMWVDGVDPKWQKKKLTFTGKINDNTELDNIGRYVNNDELKYSLRSVEKHAPWIRKIYIVTDEQIPGWLNTSNPKIQVVDHTEIIPHDLLPCFNSSVIEYFIYKIAGLTEHFLFANDDFFFNADLSPDYFFLENGFPIVRLKRKPLGKWHYRIKRLAGKKIGQYAEKIHDGTILIEKRFNKYYPGVPHHNIDAYRKSEYQKCVEEIFVEQIKRSQSNRVRAYGDLHRSVFSYYALAVGNAQLKYVGRRESSRILVHRHDFFKYMERYKPQLFCLNDSQKVTMKQRQKIGPFLENLFPEKSSFEK